MNPVTPCHKYGSKTATGQFERLELPGIPQQWLHAPVVHHSPPTGGLLHIGDIPNVSAHSAGDHPLTE